MVNKILDYIIDISKYISAILMAAITLLTFYEVGARYVFGKPWIMSNALIMFFFPWMLFIAMVTVTANKEHMEVLIIKKMLPEKMQGYLTILSRVIMLIFLVFIFISGIQLSLVVISQKIPLLNISKAWIYMSMSVSAFGMIAVMFKKTMKQGIDKPRRKP